MPIYKMAKNGKFEQFEKTPFPDLEKVLEDWIEKNPHLVLEDEEVAIIARQPRTGFDKYLDLLAVDESGATVVIELKRGETPRVGALELRYRRLHEIEIEVEGDGPRIVPWIQGFSATFGL